MSLSEDKIKQILIKENYITEDDVKRAGQSASENNVAFIDFLLDEQLIDKDILGQAIAEYYKVPYLNLSKAKIDEKAFHLIPEIMAKAKKIIVFALDEQGVKTAMNNPADMEAIHLLEKRTGQKVVPYYISEEDLRLAFAGYQSDIRDEFKNFVGLKKGAVNQEKKGDTIVKMVDALLKYGYQNKASDIHIEPYEKKIVVRFRIDGIMHDVVEIPKEFVELITTRIKILSKMRTDEHRAAQDGKFYFKTDKERVDVRVSIVPTTSGENVVLRILSAHNRQLTLTDLGFGSDNFKKIKQAIKKPHGMILVTGPTGSGKTTSLYAMLKVLNKREVHIATIEDPVEYDIESITQIQVDPKTNLTFAKGLRALVRQDPDIIMVGEIRDTETAGIAINSALTGHLVLSTLHTNNAVTALPRLLDMDIETFLVASTVNIIIAQRLVRQICANCRESHEFSLEEKDIINSDARLKEIFAQHGFVDLEKSRVYKGGGCKACNNTGYEGRVGIFEVLEMDEEVKKMLLAHASSDEIESMLIKNKKMTTMLEDGIGKIVKGLTTLSEVFRVTSE